MQTAHLQDKWNFLNVYDSVRISLLLALGLGVLWMLFVQFFPRLMATVVTVLAIIALGFLGILFLSGKISGIQPWVTLLIGLFLVALAILFACFLCFYRLRNKLIGIFLDWSTVFLKEHCIYFFYTFVFIALTAGLIVLCMFQHLAYLSHSDLMRKDNDIYLNLSTNPGLFLLNIV